MIKATFTYPAGSVTSLLHPMADVSECRILFCIFYSHFRLIQQGLFYYWTEPWPLNKCQRIAVLPVWTKSRNRHNIIYVTAQPRRFELKIIPAHLRQSL